MESAISNYWTFWLVYLLAATVFYGIFWRFTASLNSGWLQYVLRSVSAAIILTPWYTNSQESLMAPALMIAVLDGITIGADAAIRAVVPLMLAIILAVMLAAALLFLNKYISIKVNKNK